MNLNSVEEIIADIRQGKMVVLMDDEDRENEGDLIMAAELVRPEDINFMARHARGLICLTLTAERCEYLGLRRMVESNGAQFQTNFTVSIEAAEGVTTGISAADRAHTVRVAVGRNSKPGDIVTPGHVFPLMAQAGGVLSRAGHTEAGCDLARLAGFEPAAVIVEIMNEDGSMARRPDLEVFAQAHGLKIGTIADLIHYRTLNERTVARVEEHEVDTEFGVFTLRSYCDSITNRTHLALFMGEFSREDAILVRVHITDTLRDLLGVRRTGSAGWPLHRAMAKVAEEGRGVVLLLNSGLDPFSLEDRIHTFFERISKSAAGSVGAYQTVGTGSQILRDLGVGKMRLLSAPIKFSAISGFDLEVVEYLSFED